MRKHKTTGALIATEKEEQNLCKQLYVLFGCECADFSQPRASMQTPGVPDLCVWWPATNPKLFWWHEVKAEDGSLSEPQCKWKARSDSVNQVHIIGGYEQAVELLRSLGIMRE